MTNEQLVLRIKAGIDVADNMAELWKQNKGFIYKTAHKYETYAEVEDLIQEGYFGLNDAVEHYDPEEGVLFLSYAAFWIRQRMIRYIHANGTIRLPDGMYEKVREYRIIINKWQKCYDRKPTNREICHLMCISKEKLESIEKASGMANIGSLDVSVSEDEEHNLYNLVSGEENVCDCVIDKVQNEELAAVLWGLVDELPVESQNVIRKRFKDNLTLREISEHDGITIETTRKWEAKGLRELRKPSRSNCLRPFLQEDSELYSRAMHGNGVAVFNRTWTSSTERALGL